MMSLSSPRRDAKRWLVLASALLGLVIGAVVLAVGLRELQAGEIWTQPVPGAFMLVAAVMLFVVGAAAIQEYVTGTRVRERAFEARRCQLGQPEGALFHPWRFASLVSSHSTFREGHHMNSLAGRHSALVCCLILLLIPAGGAEAQAPTDETYPVFLTVWAPFRVVAVESDDTIRLEPAREFLASPLDAPLGATEGYCRSIATRSTATSPALSRTTRRSWARRRPSRLEGPSSRSRTVLSATSSSTG